MGTWDYWVRRADWLDAGRVRGYSLLVGLAALVILVVVWAQAMSSIGSDFLAFWGAGQVTASGDPAAAYDLAVQEKVQMATGASGWFAFVNPPPFLFVTAPLGLLPYPVAWPIWVLATYAFWAAAALCAFPRLWPIVITYPGALIGATHAQTGLLTGGLLVLALIALERRPFVAGGAIGALIIKPHLAVLLPFWLAAGGKWRVFVAATGAVLLLIAASALAFGPEILAAYVTSWDASAKLMREADYDFLMRMCSAYAPLRYYLGERLALALAAVFGLATIAIALLSWRRFGGDVRASGAAVLAATALASPYLFNYDLPFLVLPTLWLVEQGLAKGFRDYEKLALVFLWLAPYATRAAALPTGFNLMPLAAMALLALVWGRGGSRWLANRPAAA